MMAQRANDALFFLRQEVLILLQGKLIWTPLNCLDY